VLYQLSYMGEMEFVYEFRNSPGVFPSARNLLQSLSA